MEQIFAQKRLIIAGHRGVRALFPENTLCSFQAAIDLGLDMIETDLQLTADHEIVLIHDDTLDRTTNGSGPVGQYTLQELRRLDAGIRFSPAFTGQTIPTLKELCELVRPCPDLLLNIEIKTLTQETVDRAVTLLSRCGLMGRCVFSSVGPSILAYLHDCYGVRTQGFTQRFFEACHMKFEEGPGGTYSKMSAVGLEVSEVTQESIRFFRERGIEPWAWCPDDEASVSLCLEHGVNLVTCNEPHAALNLRRALFSQ